MKKIFSQITSYLVAASLVTSPLLAQAQSNQRSTVPEKFQKEFDRDKNFLNKLGYENIRWDDKNNRALVYGDKGKLVLEMPYTSADELRKYSPSNLEARLLKEMAQFNLAYENASDAVKGAPQKAAKAGQWVKGKYVEAANTRAGQKAIKTAKVFGGSFGAAWSHAYKRLPAESAMFFMAMGAVAAGQLFLNYSQNPIAFQQHLEHQLSPLGVIGFWSFMLTQGVASNVLMSYMGNSKLRFMIPYLGMTVGFFVQSWLSQVLADPNVMVCAKSMIGMKPTQKDYELGAVEKPCDAAYEYLVVRKQLRVLAPGLASMLLSSAAAAVLQKGAQIGAARLGFTELAILLTPGQMQIKGLRAVLVHGAQITTFVALDAWFNRWVTAAWKNTFDGKGILYTNEEMVDYINVMKEGGWQGDGKTLVDKVKEFKGQMADWRMMNLASVYEAHANWSSALGKMTGTYNASKQFYEDFSDQIRNSQYNLQVMKPLQQIYPLKGVLADGLPRDGEEPRDSNMPIETLGSRYFSVSLPTNPLPATPAESDQYFTFPKNLEAQQVRTVEKAVIFMEYKLANNGLKMNPAETAAVKKAIADLRAGLKSYSLERGYFLGRAIYEFNRMRYNLLQSRSQTQDFAYLVSEAYKMMGRPDPMLAPGRGWVTTYSEAPINQDHLKGAEFDHSKHQVGVFAAPTVGDKFVMQMLCGPDANSGQLLTEDKWGFPANFTPPRIHTGALNVSAICDPGFAKANSVQLKHADLFYTETVNKIAYVPDSNRKAKNNAITTTYRGYLEYMIDNSIAEAIGNAEKSTMKDWWERTTESQMASAFEVYSRSYNEIIAELLEGMFKTDRHILNKAPFANGVVQSIREQEDVYYTMLSEMLYPSKNTTFALHVGQKRKRVRMHPALVKVQREFDILVDMMEQIKVVQPGQVPDTKCRPRCPGPVDYLRISSDLENTDIDKQVENVKLALSKVAQELEIASAPVPAADAMTAPSLEDIDLEAEEAPAPLAAAPAAAHSDFVGPVLPKLNKAQAAFATEVLEGLDALAQEFSTYARIANAVTWTKVQHMKENDESQNALMEKIRKMGSSLVPGR